MNDRTLTTGIMADGVYTVRLARPKERNSITAALVRELRETLRLLEETPDCQAIVIEGTDGFFCTGMSFQSFEDGGAEAEERAAPDPEEFLQLLKSMSTLSRMLIAKVDGQAMAGGLGLMAACDYAIATPRSSFALPEAIWGLVPALIAPYLIRRIGYWPAYQLALTTLPLSATEALEYRLVDKVEEDPDRAILQLCKRTGRISPGTVRETKEYFGRMWIMNEAMEKAAVDEITRLTASPEIRQGIQNYLRYRVFPWEKR